MLNEMLNSYYFLKIYKDYIRADIFTENFYISFQNYYNNIRYSMYILAENNNIEPNFTCYYDKKIVNYQYVNLITLNNVNVDKIKWLFTNKISEITEYLEKINFSKINKKFFYEDIIDDKFSNDVDLSSIKSDYIIHLLKKYSNNIRFIKKKITNQEKSYILYNEKLYKRKKVNNNSSYNFSVLLNNKITKYMYLK